MSRLVGAAPKAGEGAAKGQTWMEPCEKQKARMLVKLEDGIVEVMNYKTDLESSRIRCFVLSISETGGLRESGC